jgi:hypothetical protein
LGKTAVEESIPQTRVIRNLDMCRNSHTSRNDETHATEQGAPQDYESFFVVAGIGQGLVELPCRSRIGQGVAPSRWRRISPGAAESLLTERQPGSDTMLRSRICRAYRDTILVKNSQKLAGDASGRFYLGPACPRDSLPTLRSRPPAWFDCGSR